MRTSEEVTVIQFNKLDGILLDVDGTLWDSTDEVARSYNESIQRHSDTGVVLDGKRLKQLFGKPMDEICAQVFPMLEPEEQMKLGECCFMEENEWLKEHHVPLYENVYETLEQLSQKVPLYIVSNCQKGYIEILFETTGIGPFIKGHLCYGDTGTSKGKTIRTLMEQYHLENVVYVGDTQGDADACKEANVSFIFAAYGFGDVAEYDAKIDDIRDLLECVIAK